jgi:hypothetical protein
VVEALLITETLTLVLVEPVVAVTGLAGLQTLLVVQILAVVAVLAGKQVELVVQA